MAEAFVAVIVKSRQHGGKDQPPKLLCNLPAPLTFQQEFFVSNKRLCYNVHENDFWSNTELQHCKAVLG